MIHSTPADLKLDHAELAPAVVSVEQRGANLVCLQVILVHYTKYEKCNRNNKNNNNKSSGIAAGLGYQNPWIFFLVYEI